MPLICVVVGAVQLTSSLVDGVALLASTVGVPILTGGSFTSVTLMVTGTV